MKCILLTQAIAQKTIKIICIDEKSEKYYNKFPEVPPK